MPRFHKHGERNACCVLTAIRGAVVTFQLTDGEKKLGAAGIATVRGTSLRPVRIQVGCVRKARGVAQKPLFHTKPAGELGLD